MISSISRVLQKLLKYLNGTAISSSIVLPEAGVLHVVFNLDLNDSELFIEVLSGSSL